MILSEHSHCEAADLSCGSVIGICPVLHRLVHGKAVIHPWLFTMVLGNGTHDGKLCHATCEYRSWSTVTVAVIMHRLFLGSRAAGAVEPVATASLDQHPIIRAALCARVLSEELKNSCRKWSSWRRKATTSYASLPSDYQILHFPSRPNELDLLCFTA